MKSVVRFLRDANLKLSSGGTKCVKGGKNYAVDKVVANPTTKTADIYFKNKDIANGVSLDSFEPHSCPYFTIKPKEVVVGPANTEKVVPEQVKPSPAGPAVAPILQQKEVPTVPG
jgi:hypothetical protein